MNDYYFSWAWSPRYLQLMEKSERRSSSGLILPASPADRPADEDAAICHYSTMRDGEQYAWLWLFENERDAVALRLLPKYIGNDPAAELIRSTLPADRMGQPANTYLQVVPMPWLKSWNYSELGIQEVWVNFSHKLYKVHRKLEESVAHRFSVEEFEEYLRRGRAA